MPTCLHSHLTFMSLHTRTSGSHDHTTIAKIFVAKANREGATRFPSLQSQTKGIVHYDEIIVAHRFHKEDYYPLLRSEDDSVAR